MCSSIMICVHPIYGFGVLFVVEKKLIANSTWAPSLAVRPALNAKASRLRVGAPLLPDEDTAGCDGAAFLGVESSLDHWEDLECDGVEDDLGIMWRAYFEVRRRRVLHDVAEGDVVKPVVRWCSILELLGGKLSRQDGDGGRYMRQDDGDGCRRAVCADAVWTRRR